MNNLIENVRRSSLLKKSKKKMKKKKTRNEYFELLVFRCTLNKD